MNPESMAHSIRKLSISVHELNAPKLQALLGFEGRKASVGVDAAPQRRALDSAVKEKESVPKVSPLPLPEHIIQLIIDVVRLEKEQALAACAAEDAMYTHKAAEHANRFDGDLKNLSLVSRLWTQPARHALGRRLVLIMDAKRLRTLSRAVESPLYGAWTQRVEVIEMPYAPAHGKEYVEEIWKLAQRVVSRLENIKSFTFNSNVFWSNAGMLNSLMSSFKSLEELTLFNTGTLMAANLTESCLSFQLPLLRRVTFRRCLPVPEDTRLALRDAPDFAQQLRSMKSLLFTPLNSCFRGHSVSFVFDEEIMQWVVDELKASNLSSHCGEGCLYEDAFGVCARVRSLHLAVASKSPSPACLTKVMRNFSHAKAVRLVLVDLPTQDIFDSLSHTLESAVFELKSVPTLQEAGTLDEQLARLCDARRGTLHRIVLSLSEGEGEQTGVFPSTQAWCSKYSVEFTVT